MDMDLFKKTFGKSHKEVEGAEWERLYDSCFMKMEKIVPFQKGVVQPNYRFRWITSKYPSKNKLNILDVGCANGTLCYLSKGWGNVTGVDVSLAAVEAARANVPEGTFVQAHVDQKLPFENDTFDVVSCLEVLEHVKDLNKAVAELVRVMKPEGKLLITVPVDHAYDNPYHVRYFKFYDVTDLLEQFVEDFKICRIFKISPKEVQRNLWAIEVNGK